MSLSPKTKRCLWISAIVLAVLIALGGWFTWKKIFREEKEVFANEEEHFKYGSLGAEGDRGIPYYLWLVLPRVFPDLMPGPGGYKSLGVVWEEGHEIPVGFSKKVVGFARITNNCAVCHTATYRLNEDEVQYVADEHFFYFSHHDQFYRVRRDKWDSIYALYKAETDRERLALSQLTNARRTLLKKIRSDSKSNEQASQELERASKRIRGLIDQLEKRRLASERGAPGTEPPLLGDFGRNRGRLPWPVNGRVARSFGNQTNPRFNTTTFNSGIDIASTFGTPITAVARGRVDYVNWLEGYGKCVIINHGGGFYTLYAHASEIGVTVGKEVAAGEIIGRVGDTGSTIGTALHFEIRKGREALNPLEWFR